MATVTIAGRLTADPTLRFTNGGDAVASFTVAYSRRKYDKSTGQWSDDGDALFLNVSAWRLLGEGAADQLKKGDPVVVSGELKQRNWEKDGQKRSSIELVADEVGLSVRARKNSQQEAQPAEAPW